MPASVGDLLGGAALWSAAPGDPTTATIAMYKRERDAAAGTIIAVSANYTAYGIRGGLIRVIHRHSDAMGLLRGHSHNPQDLAFLAGTDVLASVAGDGNLFVWKLQRADSGEISPEEVFHATWEAKASGPPERLAFKPAAEPGLLVTVSHHGDDGGWSCTRSGSTPSSIPKLRVERTPSS